MARGFAALAQVGMQFLANLPAYACRPPTSGEARATLGDEAALVAGGCACPLQAQGWSTHLRSARPRE